MNTGILLGIVLFVAICTIALGYLLRFILPLLHINVSNRVVFISAFFISACFTLILL